MPTFDYVCRACGETTEVFQRTASRGAPASCPACGAKEMTRALSAPRGRVKREAAPTCCGEAAPCASSACMGGACPHDH